MRMQFYHILSDGFHLLINCRVDSLDQKVCKFRKRPKVVEKFGSSNKFFAVSNQIT